MACARRNPVERVEQNWGLRSTVYIDLAEQEREPVRCLRDRRKGIGPGLVAVGVLLALGITGIMAQGRAGFLTGVSRADSARAGNTEVIPTTGTSVSTAGTGLRQLDRSLAIARGDTLDQIRAMRSPELETEILEIARTSVAVAIVGQQSCDQDEDRRPGFRNSVLAAPAGVFVTLILDGGVRGCMGTVYPVEASLADEIAGAARMAATSDPRRPPVSAEEVQELEFCVSVVGRLRREKPDSGVDPRREGVIVRANGRAGIILPGEARTGAYEIAWAKREAGIGPGDHFELYVFEVERFGKALPLRR